MTSVVSAPSSLRMCIPLIDGSTPNLRNEPMKRYASLSMMDIFRES
jgi:hypothetical protein